MKSKIIKAVIVAAVLAVVIRSLPDLKRYLELREMWARTSGTPRASGRGVPSRDTATWLQVA